MGLSANVDDAKANQNPILQCARGGCKERRGWWN